MAVALIDYGAGNLRSAAKALEAAGASDVLVTADPAAVLAADRIVLPGVGAFGACAASLRAIPGMEEALNEAVRRRARPFLGICVGMQLMASRGLDHDVTQGFGWIPGDVKAIAPRDASFKIPHMGWNTLDQRRPHALLGGIPLGENGLHAYFVHSYHLEAQRASDVIATTEHGQTVTAMVGRDNLAGTQFHPEKSQLLGLTLLANFLRWRP